MYLDMFTKKPVLLLALVYLMDMDKRSGSALYELDIDAGLTFV